MMTNSFWALVSLILFIAILLYYKIPAMLKEALHNRAQRISDELEEARRLREEAQQILADYQKKRLDAEHEAEEIIASAQRQAENIIADMRRQTQDYIAGRNKMAEQRIKQAETDAVRFIRASAVDKAIGAAGKVMENKIKTDGAEGKRLFAKALDSMEDYLKKAS